MTIPLTRSLLILTLTATFVLASNVPPIASERSQLIEDALFDGFKIAHQKIKEEKIALRNQPRRERNAEERIGFAMRQPTEENILRSVCLGRGMKETAAILNEKLSPADTVDILRQINVKEIDFTKFDLESECEEYLTRETEEIDCTLEEHQKYRRNDGVCNNLNDKYRGAANMPYARFMEPMYSDYDGTEFRNDAFLGGWLENPRTIARKMINKLDEAEASTQTTMVAYWGQFLAHDITLAGEETNADGTSIDCCPTRFEFAEDYETPCVCIDTTKDNFYIGYGVSCLRFVRTMSDGTSIPRQQVNQLSSYIDGTQMYGSTADEEVRLYANVSGRLVTLGVAEDNDACSQESCPYAFLPGEIDEDDNFVFYSGDSRSTENAGLASLHTVFMRLHNLFALDFALLYDSWNNDTIFREAKRVSIALLQVITYNEFLPVVLGDSAMDYFNLKLDDSVGYTYDDTLDATLPNVFAAAAFRFGHSMVQNTVTNDAGNSVSLGKNLADNQQQFLRKKKWYPSKVMTGNTMKACQAVDGYIVSGLTNKLFMDTTTSSYGSDLYAFNIHRGRDHGLPAYLYWREAYGKCLDESLPTTFDTFNDLTNVVMTENETHALSKVYNHTMDIDLYVGGLLEKADAGEGLLGPTFKCIIGEVFNLLKFGDRFFFLNPTNANPFNQDQMDVLRNITLREVICLTTTADSLQRNVFLQTDTETNPSDTCDNVLQNGYLVDLIVAFFSGMS